MVHKYNLNGYNIVLDSNSGAVHVVDDLMYELLDYIKEAPQEECPAEIIEKLADTDKLLLDETYTEIYDLYKSGMLFSIDDYERFSGMMKDSPIKAMCLHIAHDCNLRCEYCFAGKGDYAGLRNMMPFEVGKRAVDFLIEKSEGRKNLELDFFGGEPLMNFDVVKKIVKYARSKEEKYNKVFRFTITTNGLLLDEDKMEFINEEMSNVVLSIDGRPEVNDKVRSHVDGSGCYNKIMPKFVRLVEKREHKNYYVRGTFTKYNKDFAQDVLHLNSLGFKQISVEPVVSGPSQPYALTDEDLPEIFAEYEKLANIILEKKKNSHPFNFFHFMIDLEQGPCAIKRLRGCGCGNEYVAITPDGDIYPCHQFVGHEDWKMGSLLENVFDTNLKNKFENATIYNKPECRDCWAKFYCSGGCNANNMQYKGDILKAHTISCEMEKKRVECAIMMKVAEMDLEEDK